MPNYLSRRFNLRPAVCIAALCAATCLISHVPARAGVTEAVTAFDRGDHAQAVAEILPLAKAGDARAQHVYGAMIESEKIKVPGATAIEWYQRSAEQGYAKAKYAYARLIVSDIPVQEEAPARVVALLEEAAAQGIVPAGRLLGSVLRSQVRSAAELRHVVSVYTRMAEAGDTEAMVELGKILSARSVSSSDLKEAGFMDGDKTAFGWFHRAAMAQNPSGQVWLARSYEKGQGVARNTRLAWDWYTIAAKHDDAAAQYKLASLYLMGEDVPQDRKAAFSWNLRAAEQGLGPAMLNAGLSYAVGSGVAKDVSKGYFWLSLAQREDEEAAAKYLSMIKAQLGQKKIAALNKQVAAWKPRDGEAVRLEIERMQARSIEDV
jgi:uncharacterized protein